MDSFRWLLDPRMWHWSYLYSDFLKQVFRLSEAGVARFLPIALVKPLKLNGLSRSIMVTNPPEPNMMHSATSSGLFHYQSLDLPCLESIIPSCFDLDRMVIYCWCEKHITRCFYAVAIFTDSFRPQTKQLMIRNFQDSQPKKKHVTTSRQPGREKPPLIWTSLKNILTGIYIILHVYLPHRHVEKRNPSTTPAWSNVRVAANV